MNLVRRAAIETRSAQLPGAGMSLMDLDNLMAWSAYGVPTYTGKTVSQLSALQQSAVWACVDVRSGDLATAPLLPYRRGQQTLSSGRFTRELATDHYLWPILTHAANREMTAFRFKQLMEAWICLWGNAYAEIETNGRGQVTALWPWRPDRVRVDRKTADSPIIYTYRMQTGEIVSRPHDLMLHLRGLGVDGLMGLSPIEMHRQAIGLNLAMQEHGARLFGNGARPLGILEIPNRLPKEGGVEEVRKQWDSIHGGLQNSQRIAILQEGVKYKEAGLNMVDAQYLETQKFGLNEIARIFGVPPHRIADLDRSTNNNIEHQGIEYVQFCLGREGANWQNEFAFSLLSSRESDSVFVEFDFSHLLQGDLESLAKIIPAVIQNGVLDQDEVREKFFKANPFQNDWGSRPWIPLNMARAGDVQPTLDSGKRALVAALFAAMPAEFTEMAVAIDAAGQKQKVNGKQVNP